MNKINHNNNYEHEKSLQKQPPKIALIGNPNVGKSSIFNLLTGMRQHTGNWTGKTVSLAYGKCKTENKEYTLIDLPGTYSLNARSPEEKISRDYINSDEAFATVVVCDATCLRRSMNLVLQVMNISKRVIVCINLIDEANRRGISIDTKLLSSRLGVPVVTTSARNKKKIKALTDAMDSLTTDSATHYHTEIPQHLTDSDMDFYTFNEKFTEYMSEKTKELLVDVINVKENKKFMRDIKLDKILTSRLLGYPIMVLLLLIILWITMVGANYPSEYLALLLNKTGLVLAKILKAINTPDTLYSILLDGIWKTLSTVVSVMLPPMAIFFPLFTILEDSGYLPRIAYNLDHSFKKCNACGKQALTLCMGFGCNAVGVVGCRIIDSPRERMLAILTNSLVPCNGKFPTLIALISVFLVGSFGLGASFLKTIYLCFFIIFSIFITFIATKILSKTLLKGLPSSFILELPSYRKPQIGKVIVRSVFDRTLFVLARSVAVAAPAGAVIWIMANIKIDGASILHYCSDMIDPFARLIGLDGIILTAFILGFPANETVIPIALMGYLSTSNPETLIGYTEMRNIFISNGWTPITALCTLIFMLFHSPCSTTLITIYKETHSIKWTLLSALIPTTLGVLICFVINAIASFF